MVYTHVDAEVTHHNWLSLCLSMCSSLYKIKGKSKCSNIFILLIYYSYYSWTSFSTSLLDVVSVLPWLGWMLVPATMIVPEKNNVGSRKRKERENWVSILYICAYTCTQINGSKQTYCWYDTLLWFWCWDRLRICFIGQRENINIGMKRKETQCYTMSRGCTFV